MTKTASHHAPRGVSRRQILKAGAGTAALLAAAKLNFPAGAFAEGAGPEVTAAKLGFIALTDASPLFVAKEKGIFAKYGMPDVEVQKQASWGTTRDNLVLGSEGNGIDGAHILTPMPYLISSGKVTQNNVPTPMYILARLNLNGQGISVAKEYADLKVGLICADRDGNRIRIDHVDVSAGKLSYHFLNDELRVQEGIQEFSILQFLAEGWYVARPGAPL